LVRPETMRSRTSVSQAIGSTPFSFAVWIFAEARSTSDCVARDSAAGRPRPPQLCKSWVNAPHGGGSARPIRLPPLAGQSDQPGLHGQRLPGGDGPRTLPSLRHVGHTRKQPARSSTAADSSPP
jgi:hypothetical protein